jgi:hypothetical protein
MRERPDCNEVESPQEITADGANARELRGKIAWIVSLILSAIKCGASDAGFKTM